MIGYCWDGFTFRFTLTSLQTRVVCSKTDLKFTVLSGCQTSKPESSVSYRRCKKAYTRKNSFPIMSTIPHDLEIKPSQTVMKDIFHEIWSLHGDCMEENFLRYQPAKMKLNPTFQSLYLSPLSGFDVTSNVRAPSQLTSPRQFSL
jgi:hypothetical protein